MPLKSAKINIQRNGNWDFEDAAELVPGDHIILADGEVVPADCVLLCQKCIVDESMLTGESMPVTKV